MPADGTEALAQQRYFNFVITDAPAGLQLGDLWSTLEVGSLRKGRFPPVEVEGLRVEHRRLKTDLRCARGPLEEAASINRDGQPPYLYDFITAEIDTANGRWFAVGFPFTYLARRMVDRMMEASGVRAPSIKSINVSALLQAVEQSPVSGSFALRAVGIGLVAKADANMSNLEIEGDDPLSADIYDKVLKKHVHNGDLAPQSLILRCELASQDEPHSPRLRAIVHTDVFGNVRFYVHSGAANVPILQPLTTWIGKLNGFDNAASNPLKHQRQQDD